MPRSGLVGDDTMSIGSEQSRSTCPGGAAPAPDVVGAGPLGDTAGFTFPVHAATEHKATITPTRRTVRMVALPPLRHPSIDT
jgi:hypothetical protein